MSKLVGVTELRKHLANTDCRTLNQNEGHEMVNERHFINNIFAQSQIIRE